MNKLSIIIPFYNSENTLIRCLDSIVCQDLNLTEILLVNDGSTDDSINICKKYASEYSNIKIFTQHNSGVSSARNLGIKNASGEYITFVDSDDTVSPDYVATIIAAISHHSPDLLLFGASRSDGNIIVKLCPSCMINEVAISKMLCKYMKSGCLGGPWTKAFRADIIRREHIYFPEDISIAEDLAFTLHFALYVQCLATIEENLYYVYTENQSSLSRKNRPDLYIQLHRASILMQGYVNQSVVSSHIKKTFLDTVSWMYYRSVYSSAREFLKFINRKSERINLLRNVCRYYNKNHVRIYSFSSACIMIPVKVQAASLIDCIANFRLIHK